MTDTPTQADPAAADIAWMRNLAEEGARTPMQGGSILMTAGLTYGAASLFHYAQEVSGVERNVGIGWIVATVAFLAFIAIAIPRLKRTEGVMTAANKASGMAWSSMGWGIFALFLAMAVVSWRLQGQSTGAMFALIPSVIMVFYGVGWAVSASMHRSRSMGILSLASFAAAPIMAVFANQPAQYLAYAAALLGLMALPGFLFMRAAGRA